MAEPGPMPPTFEAAVEAWMRSKGVALAPVTDAERRAALQRVAKEGDPARRRALRLVALWSLAGQARATNAALSLTDMADFIEAEGFALIDGWGERTLAHEEKEPCTS